METVTIHIAPKAIFSLMSISKSSENGKDTFYVISSDETNQEENIEFGSVVCEIRFASYDLIISILNN